MASLRIVGIDPATSGANQLAAQGLDTVLINDIHGSTALNLASTGAGSTTNFYVGGTAAAKQVLKLTDPSATFNPSGSTAFQGVLINGGTTDIGLLVSSPATTTQSTLTVKQLGTADALEVFGTGAALLQLGDGGTYLYNKVDSDMELYTYGLGSTFIQGGSGGTVEMTVEAATSGNGGGVYVSGGSSSAASASGGIVQVVGGSADSATSGVGGPVTVKGGSSTGSTGGSLTLSGGPTSKSTAVGGFLAITGGGNFAASGDPSKQGSVVIGFTNTNGIQIGDGSFSTGGQPGTVSLKGHLTSSPAAIGGQISVLGGASTGGGVGGPVTIDGGSSDLSTGGNVEIGAGNTQSASAVGGNVVIVAGSGSVTTDPSKQGTITVGAVSTNAISMGGGSFSTGPKPGTVALMGHSTSVSGIVGGDVSVAAGSSNHVLSSAGGTVSLSGGYSLGSLGGNVSIAAGGSGSSSGGDVELFAGATSASTSSGSVLIRAGSNTASSGTSSFHGSVYIGTSDTNAISIGSSSFSSGSPSPISIYGHSTSGDHDTGGGVVVRGGNATGAAPTVLSETGGYVSVIGGLSSFYPGGNVSILGGDTSSSTVKGGNIIVEGGDNTASASYSGLGGIYIGNSRTSVITIGGGLVTTAAGTPGDVSILGHSLNGLSSQTGGAVRVKAGDATAANSTGGGLYLDPGAGPSVSQDGIIHILSNNGTIVSIGDGTIVPKVNIRDGYLSFTDTTSTSDSNPTGTASVVKNSLYAKNTVDAWARNYGGTIGANFEGFGIVSMFTYGSSPNIVLRVTFRTSSSPTFRAQAVIATGDNPTFLSTTPVGVNVVDIRGFILSGGVFQTRDMTTVSWYLLRMTQVA